VCVRVAEPPPVVRLHRCPRAFVRWRGDVLAACCRVQDNLRAALAWVEANFASLQFYSVAQYVDDFPEYATKSEEGEDVNPTFGANMAYLLHNEDGARFYFVKGAFSMMKV
jgi:hypothetical protein